MLNVLIVRHGQSEWNAVGRWQGRADPPLSEAGIEQARTAAAALGRFDAIVASDLDRAATTAGIVAEAMGIGPVVHDPELRERDVGEWQGLTREEIDVEFPGFLDDGRRPPSWETDESILARALRSLDRISEHVGSGEVLVVAHGGIIYRLEAHLGATFAPIKNLHGRWFHLGGDRMALGDRVELAPEPEGSARSL